MADAKAQAKRSPPSLKELMKIAQQGGVKEAVPADVKVQAPAEAERLRMAVLGIDQVGGAESSVRLIPIDLIDENPLAQRFIYLDHEIHEIALSLQSNKQRDPIHVWPNPDKPGRFIISDGWTRVLAIRMFGAELGLPDKVEAKIEADFDELEGCLQGYLQNEERNPLADIDKGMLFSRLISEKGLTNKDLKEKFNIKHEPDITYLISFGKLDPAVIKIIGPYKAKVSRFFSKELLQIQKYHGVDAAKDVAQQLVEGVDYKSPDYKLNMTLDALKEKGKHLDKVAAAGGSGGGDVVPKDQAEDEDSPPPGQNLVKKHDVFRLTRKCTITDTGSIMDVKIKYKSVDPTIKEELSSKIRAVLEEYKQYLV